MPQRRGCRSAFYAWTNAAPGRAERAARDAALATQIKTVQDPKQGGDRAYGAPRVTAELNDGAAPEDRVNHKRVARVMRTHHLPGLRLRRRVRTTVPEPANTKVEDLVKRDFTAPAPNRKYVGDITYLPLACGKNLYLATVIDCYSRRLVGWAVADHMRTELIAAALRDAAATRGSLAGAVFHGDHGAQYTSRQYAELCNSLGVTQSMGAVAAARTTPSPSLSTPPSSASSCTAPRPGQTSCPAAATCSAGPAATTPAVATPGAASRPRTSTRPCTSLPSSKPPNHQPRVQDQGSRPLFGLQRGDAVLRVRVPLAARSIRSR